MKRYKCIFADGATQEAEMSDEPYKEFTALDRAEKAITARKRGGTFQRIDSRIKAYRLGITVKI
jgi:hypothetical protein